MVSWEMSFPDSSLGIPQERVTGSKHVLKEDVVEEINAEKKHLIC